MLNSSTKSAMDIDECTDCFSGEEALIELFSDGATPQSQSFGVCEAAQCRQCLQHLTGLQVDYKKTWIENRELRIKWQDSVKALTCQIKMLEYHVEQKQRFLEKQTQLVDILSREKGVDLGGNEGLEEHTSACERCVHHRDMWRRIRGINLEQQKRCEIESATARAIQQRQARQLGQMKMLYSRLRAQYDELMLKRHDPFCKDSEILKLRHELAESKAMTAGFNRSAFNANNEARIFMEQLEREKMQSGELRVEVDALRADLSLREEMIEVLKQTASHESKEARQLFTLGECRDLVCRNRRLATNHRVNMLTQQLDEAQRERECLQDEIRRAKGESSHWRKLLSEAAPQGSRTAGPLGGDGEGGGGAENDYYGTEEAIPAICLGEDDTQPLTVHQQVVNVLEQKSKPLVSSIRPGDEITIRLQSLFELVPGRDAELDENEMYDEFMLDQEAHKREQIVEQMFASCHNGSALPENERKRFRQATTTKNNSIRSCKRSFSACLRAIGGVMVKKRSRNIWLNFRQTRAPIFKWLAER